MKIIERIKFIIGLILASLVILAAVFYFLICFKILDSNYNYTFYNSWTRGNGGGASNTPLFFGFCAIAACYLLANSCKKEN